MEGSYSQEIKRRVSNIIYTMVIIGVLTWLWWGPYQDKVRMRESLQQHLNQTSELTTEGLDAVVINDKTTKKTITIKNDGTSDNRYTIAFMVTDGINDQNTNKNNYILYSVIDSTGSQSEPRSLSLDGGMITNKIAAHQEEQYEILLWSNENDINLQGKLALIANPIL